MSNKYCGGIVAGSTSVSIDVLLRKKSDNTGLTGLLYNDAGNIASYHRQGAARVPISMNTQTVTGAWASGGFVLYDDTNEPGLYRFDIPDLAFAAGADYVTITLVTTNGYVFHERYALSVPPVTLGNTLAVTSGGVLDLPTSGGVPSLGIVDSGTAQGISATSLTLQAAAAFGTNALAGRSGYVWSATTGIGQAFTIDSNTNTSTANVISFGALTITLTGTVKYIIFAQANTSAANPPQTVLTTAGAKAAADALLARNQKGGSDGPAGQQVADALAGGLMSLTIVAGVLTVKNGDGTTAYTRTLTRAALLAIASST